MNRNLILIIIGMAAFSACNRSNSKFDATGTFEADEVIVSSVASGKILSLNIKEGSVLAKDSIVGQIDPTDLTLQKEQVEESIHALGEQTMDVGPQLKLLVDQLAVQQSQLDNAMHERTRIEKLVKLEAATGKQLDDINYQVDLIQKQMKVTQQHIKVQKNNVRTQNSGILSQGKPLKKRVAQLQELIKKTNIINPVNGTVLTKYAEAGEIASGGKALYSIADLSFINLRAYISGAQLSQIKLDQQVKVLSDSGANKYREYAGNITWISDKAEFTPKTIQTKEERANLVYAIKIKVKNDGYLKIGMYGEVLFIKN